MFATVLLAVTVGTVLLAVLSASSKLASKPHQSGFLYGLCQTIHRPHQQAVRISPRA